MSTLDLLRDFVSKFKPYLLLALLPGGFILAPLLLLQRRYRFERVFARANRGRGRRNPPTW